MKKITFIVLFLFGLTATIAQTNCTNALPILLNSTTTAPSFVGETGNPPMQLCGLTTAGTIGKWYKYEPLTTGEVIISTILPQNNNADTRLIVYSGTCTSLVCINANDDFNGSLGSQVNFNALVGVTYYFVFDNKYNQNAFDFTVNFAPPPPPQRLSFTSQTITGITGGFNNCIVDMNGDYLDDIVSTISTTQLAISYQQSGGTFTTSTYTTPTSTVTPTWSIAAGDYDNNGYNDLLYGSGSGVVFLKANSTGTGYSIDRKPQGFLVQRTNFVDINNDGYLDGFACDDNAPNRFYMNNGTTLTPGQGGLGDFPSGGNYASNWVDFNNDGHVDMYLAKCGQGGSGVGGNIDQLYQNNGNGTYTNIAATAGMANAEQTWSGAVGDFNNDGWMDVVVGVNSSSNGFTNVKRNNGDGTFTSVTAGSGYDTNTSLGREYIAQDFDNDGFLDVLGSGNNIMFGDGNFHFVTNATPYNFSAVDRPVGDLNNDGFLDIQNGTTVLFNNGNTNKWFNVNLHGIQSNRNGIGARVEIYGAWGKQIRDVQSGTGFQNMSTLTAHFGLGQATAITQVIIRWPSGIIDTINNPAINQSLLVTEGSTLANYSFTSSEFSLYPNPAKENITIKSINGIQFSSANIIDLQGRIVAEHKLFNEIISVQELTSGTYIVLLTDENGKKYSQKFIKK